MTVKSAVLTAILLMPTAAIAGPLTLSEASSSVSFASDSIELLGSSSDRVGLGSSSQSLSSAFDTFDTNSLASAASLDSLYEFIAMTLGASKPFTPRGTFEVHYASGLYLIPWNDPKTNPETPQPVPEPATLLLLGSGMAALAARKKLANRTARTDVA
jgi:hypothetical protein